ncbi:MAG: PIN domain-containing protein [Fimbriimonadales bacterium]|nr:PIN domain-containing protein [Fimbriimonadales bacterium]
MKCLIDTNVALRWVQQNAPEHYQAVQAIQHLLTIGAEVFLSSQNLIEFWNVATRPAAVNGLGWSIERTAQAVSDLESLFVVLHENEQVYQEWKRLVTHYRVMGRQVYDARLVAFMCAHSVDWLVSFNTTDFQRYAEIQVASPSDVQQKITFGI